jgi:hypothetical protein
MAGILLGRPPGIRPRTPLAQTLFRGFAFSRKYLPDIQKIRDSPYFAFHHLNLQF